jgi:uncharacterized protein
MRILNRTRNKIIADRATVADRPWVRMRGLIGRPSLELGEGLVLIGTKGIHTVGMRFAIDVLFLNDDGCVIHLIHTFKPFRASSFIKESAMVIELCEGTLRETGTQVGDWIELSDEESRSLIHEYPSSETEVTE